MKLSDRVRIPQDVLARKVGEDMVMLDLANGAYFGLDPVGARIWQLLGEGKALAEVCDVMMEEFQVERAQIEKDVMSLAEQLETRGLISPL